MWWLLAQRPAPLRRLPTLQQAATVARDSVTQPRHGVEPMLGQARWLLRRPLSQHWFIETIGWLALIVLFVWFGRQDKTPDISVLFAGLAGWWIAAYQTLREGVRPTLLLIPGQRVRHRLGWLLYAEGLRRSLFSVAWLVTASAALLWFHAELELMQVAVPAAILWAGGAVSLACLLSISVWLRSPLLRVAAQVVTAAGSSVAGVLAAAYWYQDSWYPDLATTNGAHVLQGLLTAAFVWALSLLVVWAANRSWARADLHELFAPARQRWSELRP